MDKQKIREFIKKIATPSFSKIIDEHWSNVYSRAYALLNNHEDAEEVAQDTFIRAQRSWNRFRGDSSVKSWLFRIVTNLAYNRYWYWQRRGRNHRVSLEDNIDSSNPTGATWSNILQSHLPNPSESCSTYEFMDRIQKAIDSLRADYREILIMRTVEHLTYNEIVDRLGLSMGTVKSRLARARNELRHAFNLSEEGACAVA